MMNATTLILAALYGVFIWYMGETSGPVVAAVIVGMTSVGAAFHNEGKIKELEKRLEDFAWRLRHVMKDE